MTTIDELRNQIRAMPVLLTKRLNSIKKADEIEKILKSDCVCEKKEDKPSSCFHPIIMCESCKQRFSKEDVGPEDPSTWPTVTIDQETNTISSKGKVNIVINTKEFDMKEEKQSQSPCEHKPNDEIFIDTNKGPVTLWLCKCGLVTCVDPSRSAPSKNPNDK